MDRPGLRWWIGRLFYCSFICLFWLLCIFVAVHWRSLVSVCGPLLALVFPFAERRLQDMQASVLAAHRLQRSGLVAGPMGLMAPQLVGSSQTRGQADILCISRWILNHWTDHQGSPSSAVLTICFFRKAFFGCVSFSPNKLQAKRAYVQHFIFF